MTEPLNEIVSLLDLEQIDENIFRGHSPQTGLRQVYGGQAVAQALVAAQRTTPIDRLAHSLHAYFILAGDPNIPIIFQVERVRDGKSFTTRRCAAIQRSRAIFSLEASFQIREEGFDHAAAMPDVPLPDSLSSVNALVERFSSFVPKARRNVWRARMRSTFASSIRKRSLRAARARRDVNTSGFARGVISPMIRRSIRRCSPISPI